MDGLRWLRFRASRSPSFSLCEAGCIPLSRSCAALETVISVVGLALVFALSHLM
jgi:hypothetical protein